MPGTFKRESAALSNLAQNLNSPTSTGRTCPSLEEQPVHGALQLQLSAERLMSSTTGNTRLVGESPADNTNDLESGYANRHQ